VNEASERRCALVYNPIKVSDDLREAITRHAAGAGCLNHPDRYELDGDVIGDCRSLRGKVCPGALTVCVG
jgi:hypothetical protein